ncbi:MAG: multidrug effflux MFS transporter [Hallerella sp.]|jgi:DHA1 family bicyclomycin/chloramphenicol resistance-like MFS transporter|nr:multidrug effflux MFS transporter [Fibrobacter sp.]MDY6368454.1 multidrug effflux MFS transporter [Fibrobacter sp.]MDY6390958.1 multidrug effflux MFS transporter [Fibrobacter sp.]MEE3339150.1 multidrug effflux MFS transporter [Hallerella sp.]
MTEQKNHPNGYIYLAILLGLLTAFAPFVTDFYLPALPSLTDYFNASASAVQMSLTMSMLGLACGQLFVGPISDKFGRKKLLIGSLVVFLLTTLLCLVAPGIVSFNLFRLFQGMAGSGGLVISRSVTTDSFRGKLLSKFLALVSAINGIAPVTAPVFGGILLKFTSWKGTFVALFLIGVALLILALRFTETLPERRRSQKSLISTFALYGKVLQNGEYVRNLLVFVASQFVLFAYIAASPFIFQVGFGFSPMMFSFVFALNAIGIGVGCAVSGKVGDDLKALRGGSLLMLAASIFACAMLFLKMGPLWVEASFFVLLFSFGLLQPPATAQTLRTERANGGTASALMGALGFVMGSIASPLVGMGDTFQTLAFALLAGGICVMFATLVATSSHVRNNSCSVAA